MENKARRGIHYLNKLEIFLYLKHYIDMSLCVFQNTCSNLFEKRLLTLKYSIDQSINQSWNNVSRMDYPGIMKPYYRFVSTMN